MLRDVFYYGQKPNVHPREKPAKNLADARKQSTTEHFWIVNEFCDYRNFDWEFDFDLLPDHDVWAEDHNNVWPSTHQKDSGTWLCPKKFSDIIIYRCDVDPLVRKKTAQNNWKILENIDTAKWDFSWHPDPTDPPYIYKWGCKFFPVEYKSCIEYYVEGATDIKYMKEIVELLPNWECIKEYQQINYNKWDMSWRPHPLDPPFIYVWGNKFVDATTAPTLEYHVPGATEKKYLPEVIPLIPNSKRFEHLEDSDGIDYSWIPNPTAPPYIYAWGNQWNKPEDKISIQYVVEGATEYKYMTDRAVRKPCYDNWIVPDNIDISNFDFSWEPSPADPPYIYEFGTQWQKTGGPRYIVLGATTVKYIDFNKVTSLPVKSKFTIINNYKIKDFDYSWHHDTTEEPYIYVFGNNQYLGEIMPTIEYRVQGATKIKYVDDIVAILDIDMDNWIIPNNVDVTNFDFSWKPNPKDPPYIYQFGTQWQKTGGPKYIVPNATEVKYVNFFKVANQPDRKNFAILNNYKIKNFDFSWHPDGTEEPFIYVFGNNQYPAEIMPTIEYIVPGAKQTKYINSVIATLDADMENWIVPDNVDSTDFDFSWKPNPKDPPFIYEFGTQWQKTGGPRYIVPNASEIKYIDIQKAKALPTSKNWTIPKNLDITGFDFSWHPDNSSPPYIYHFATQWALTGGPIYTCDGATETKYLDEPNAIALPNKGNWEYDPTLIDENTFDFSWHPYIEDQPYIYQFGTQHQKTGGPRYITPGVITTSPVKYIDTRIIKATRIKNKKKFSILNNYKIKDFDYSWHPDETDEPYIYVFGNNQYPAEIMPTIEYAMPGAKQLKYVGNIVATLDVDMSNWVVPTDLDVTDFDFSWKPNPKDPAYIYEFGTQWQKNGGPRYVVPGANEIKYVTTQRAKALPIKDKWIVPPYVDVNNFDFSWHPDNTSPPYIYHFATQWALTGGPIYKCLGATEVKYLEYPSAIALSNKENWYIPDDIDADSFDFSWHPYIEDQPYIYQFGTQHQKTGGPRYNTPGILPTSPVKYIDTRIIKATKLPNKNNFSILDNLKIKNFDWSWHPDATEEPYIYVFGNTWYSAEIMPTIEYIVSGAKKVKYVHDVVATLDIDMSNWTIPDNVDVSDFDFSWKPNPKDPPYIYQFGTQHQKTGGPRYVVPNATEVKYIESKKVKALPNKINFITLNDYKIKDFDYSWHPDSTEEPYIYTFGNNQYPAEIMPTIEYRMEGATTVKYVNNIVAKLDVDMNNWVIPSDIEILDCDFSWKPNPKDPPYVYEFGTQWQKTGGVKYIVPNATEIKYLNLFKSTKIADQKHFAILNNYKIKDFDYSWHPDGTEEPFIYVFGNNQYPAEIMPTIEYVVPGAKQTKYINSVIATLDADMSNWIIPKHIDSTDFDFSWKPNPKDPPYIYEFGTQWQKTGGPRYIVEGATEIKYVSSQQVKALPTNYNWTVPANVDVSNFDFSWHPDSTSPPYIYHFATQWALTGGPIYTCEGATEKKYLEEPSAIALPSKQNWIIPTDVDVNNFDFSWHPYIEDQPYIYQFGTQWQKTGGPRFVTPGTIPTSPVKYIDTRILKAIKLPHKNNFVILNNYKIKDFDYSWHPDETDEPYIYVFGNNQYPAEIMPTIEYKVSGAKQIKYINDVVATLDTDITNWYIPKNIDAGNFDFSWKPNPKDPPYIYEFGTQHQKTGGPRYIVDGATETKYVTTQSVIHLPDKSKFIVKEHCLLDLTDFDFSWHPDSSDPPYIYAWGNQWNKAEDKIVLEYKVEGATEYKYMSQTVKSMPSKINWQIPINIDTSDFDFSWEPNPRDDKFVYQFGTQWQKTGGPRYIIPGAENSDTKYINVTKALRLPNRNNFKILNNYKIKDFDYSWHPDETEEPYIYVFGNNQYPAEIMPTIEFVVPGATVIKYVHDIVAILDNDRTNWKLPEGIDVTDFDFSWKPNPKDPPYIYQFGTQWQKTGGPSYIVEGATQIKYIEGSKAKSLPHKRNWILPKNIPIVEFDYSWHPDATESPYIYVFGTQWQMTAGPKYVVEGAAEFKYMDINFAKAGPTEKNWVLPPDIVLESFDFSWHPHPDDPPYIYEFGTQWQKTGGPRYLIPNATEVKYMQGLGLHAKRLPSKKNWFNPFKADTTTFDYSWHPDATNPPYIYQFGSIEGENDGPRYITPGASGDIIYLKRIELDIIPEPEIIELPAAIVVEEVQENEEIEEANKKCDIFLVDRGNIETQERFEYLKEKFGNVQKTRYLNSWVDTINRCINRSTTQMCWILNSELDYTNFDFNYYPNPYQMKMVHVFGTQWSNWGTTFMVNRDTFATDTKYIKIIEHLSNLNFVKSQYVNRLTNATNNLYDIFLINHGNGIDNILPALESKSSGKAVKIIDYKQNYFYTFKSIVESLPEKKEHYIWIVSSICDYDKFDFTYICDPFAKEQLHVFPSDKQKFGDTFFVNVNRLRELINNMETLKDYDKINYNQTLRTTRLPAPIIINEFDSHVLGVMQDFNFPYATFVTSDNKDIAAMDEEPMSLWDEESKTILITSTGGTRIVVPKEAKQYIETQLYDYPYIKTASRLSKSNPLDIVYLSNGEKCAEENYEHLVKITKGLSNRLIRVDGINGRVQAYHAAAEASNTSWFLTVFAKLKVNAKFDFNWQPDRLQIPKHYMFLARNPVNGLIYGHQGMIAYNKQMTIENEGQGLDFTLDSPHETIELLSGTATFNTDEFSTWRTAFREAIKLKKENSEISLKRLEVWLTKAEGNYAEYSIHGARDGVLYYEKVNGNLQNLRMSYEWDWLHKYFKDKFT